MNVVSADEALPGFKSIIFYVCIQSLSVNYLLCVVSRCRLCSAASRREVQDRQKTGCVQATRSHLHPALWCPSVAMLTLRRTSVNHSHHSYKMLFWFQMHVQDLHLQMNKAPSSLLFFFFFFFSRSIQEDKERPLGNWLISGCVANQFRHYLQKGKVQFTSGFKPSVWFYIISCNSWAAATAPDNSALTM